MLSGGGGGGCGLSARRISEEREAPRAADMQGADMWTASTAPKRYELSIEKSNAKKARSIIAIVLARMLLCLSTVVSCWVVEGGKGASTSLLRIPPLPPRGKAVQSAGDLRRGHALSAATAALHAVDNLQPPRHRAGCGAEVAAHTAAGRRLLGRAHAGRRASRKVLVDVDVLALRAHEHVEHSRPEPSANSPFTPHQRQIKRRAACHPRPALVSLGRPRPVGRCVLARRPHPPSLST